MRAGWTWIVGVLAGCADVDPLPVGASPPPALHATAAVPGQVLEVRVDGAVRGDTVYLVSGPRLGAGPCLGLLGGDCLDVASATLLGTQRADAAGVATWRFPLGLGVPVGLGRAFQAVVARGGLADAVPAVAVEVQHPDAVCDRVDDGGHAPAAPALECDLLAAINAARAAGQDCGAAGVFPPTHPLTMNAALREASWVHAQWMADNLTLTHASPGGPLGDTFGARATAAGYDWRRLTETIARGQDTVGALMAAWLGSSAHCSDLMAADVRDIGIGRGLAANGVPYWSATQGEPQR